MHDKQDLVYDRIYCGDALVLQLHLWDAENHTNLVNEALGKPGHGVLIWFAVTDFDAAVTRARAMQADILEEVHENPNAQHREIWLRDPDSYVVVLADIGPWD